MQKDHVGVFGARAIERFPDGIDVLAVHSATERPSWLEAVINPIGNEAKNEWVSLYNRGSKKVTLKDWVMIDGESREAKINGSIDSGETLRLKGCLKGKLKRPNDGGSLIL